MRYPASEKLEIIRTVEASHLPTKQTLAMIGIPSSTYYDWYARWSDGGIDALADRSPRPGSVWNRIPDTVREDIVGLALVLSDQFEPVSVCPIMLELMPNEAGATRPERRFGSA